MLLFHKKDLLVVLTKDGDTVEFSKSVKDILKYQHRYNYKFKLYETGKITVADDYIIEGETLTVFFGTAYVEYSSSGATYNEGGSGGGGGEGDCEDCVKILNAEYFDTVDYLYVYTSNGWVDVGVNSDTNIKMCYKTKDDIPVAYVLNDEGLTEFPGAILEFEATKNETHTPELTDPSGYYIEYAEGYSIFATTYGNYFLILKNGVIEYHQGQV